MQAETIGNVRTPGGRAQGPSPEPLLAGLHADNFWRIVPALFGIAAWLPQIGSAIVGLGRLPSGIAFEAARGGFVQTGVVGLVGPDGLVLLGALLSAITAYGVWAIARGLSAPRWTAALVASISLVLPLFKLAPSPVTIPDDAAFAAFMTLAMAALVWTARRENSNLLMLAFVLAIIAALLRPGAAWPAIAIGVAALLASDKLEEGPWVGMLSSLCWAPGLYIAYHFLGDGGPPATLFSEATVLDTVRESASVSANALDAARLSLPKVLAMLLTALPFVILGIAAALGQSIAFVLGGARRRAAIAASVGAVLCKSSIWKFYLDSFSQSM